MQKLRGRKQPPWLVQTAAERLWLLEPGNKRRSKARRERAALDKEVKLLTSLELSSCGIGHRS